MTVARVPVEAILALRHSVLRPGRPLESARFAEDSLDGAQHWAASDGERVVGCASVMPAPFPDGDGPAWQLRGMAVDPSLRGMGLGFALLRAIDADLGRPLWCNARTSAAGFYARAGWRVVSSEFEIPGVGPHVRMVYTP